jgi:hypothetical protein
MGNTILSYNADILNYNNIPLMFNVPPYSIDNLTGIYRFNGDLTDSAPIYTGMTANNLTGAVSYSSGGYPSSFAQCASIGVGGTPVLTSNVIMGAFSYSFWFSEPSTATGNFMSCTNSGLRCWFIFNFNANSKLNTMINYSGVGGKSSAQYFYTPNVWNHFVFTCDGAKNYKMYLNTPLLESYSYAASAINYPVQNLSGAGLGGKLASFFVYSRVLTTEEIINLYNGGLGV